MPPIRERPQKRGRPRDPAMERRILDAARAVVADRGMCSASVTAIAERAGIGKPTLYLRWRGLNEVVTAAFEELAWTEEIGARFRAAVAAIDALLQAFPKSFYFAEVHILRARLATAQGKVADATKALEAVKTAPGMNLRDQFLAEYMRVYLTLESQRKVVESLAAYQSLVSWIDKADAAQGDRTDAGADSASHGLA